MLLLALPLAVQARFATAQSQTNDSTRKVITRVVPVYPPLARTLTLTGTVKLEALVLANGTVKAVQVKGGHPVLALAAEDALRAWKWQKAEHDSTELVEFRFNP
jgi:TonB family protein